MIRPISRLSSWRRSGPLVGASTLCLLLLAGCFGEKGAEPESASTQPQRKDRSQIPEQQIFDYRFIETKQGVRQWVLESEEMLKYPGQDGMLLVDLKMDFFKEGAYHSTLTADSGRANQNTKDVHTWGAVVVVTEDGRKLETEELFFDNRRELIYNDVFDKLTRDGDVVTGIGLEATPDLEYIELKDNVKAHVGDDDSPGGEPQ
jgi:LPS export ABC transporter protein LptC